MCRLDTVTKCADRAYELLEGRISMGGTSLPRAKAAGAVKCSYAYRRVVESSSSVPLSIEPSRVLGVLFHCSVAKRAEPCVIFRARWGIWHREERPVLLPMAWLV